MIDPRKNFDLVFEEDYARAGLNDSFALMMRGRRPQSFEERWWAGQPDDFVTNGWGELRAGRSQEEEPDPLEPAICKGIAQAIKARVMARLHSGQCEATVLEDTPETEPSEVAL